MALQATAQCAGHDTITQEMTMPVDTLLNIAVGLGASGLLRNLCVSSATGSYDELLGSVGKL